MDCHSQSNNYQRFEWNILQVGIGIPINNSGFGPGQTLGSEVRVNLLNNLSLGIGVSKVYFENRYNDVSAEKPVVWTISGDYYYNIESANRFFTGLAYGVYSTGKWRSAFGQPGSRNPTITSSILEFKMGSEFNHVRWETSYNYTFKEGRVNFIAISLAYTLGGGFISK